MLRFKIENDAVVEVSSDPDREGVDFSWESRWDWKELGRPEAVAESATVLTGELYIAIDSGPGHYPRYDVIKAPVVGDKVSYAFNGDYRPDGVIVKVSPTMKVIETDSGNRYYRRKKTGSWLRGGTWSLILGHIDRRNPEF